MSFNPNLLSQSLASEKLVSILKLWYQLTYSFSDLICYKSFDNFDIFYFDGSCFYHSCHHKLCIYKILETLLLIITAMFYVHKGTKFNVLVNVFRMDPEWRMNQTIITSRYCTSRFVLQKFQWQSTGKYTRGQNFKKYNKKQTKTRQKHLEISLAWVVGF